MISEVDAQLSAARTVAATPDFLAAAIARPSSRCLSIASMSASGHSPQERVNDRSGNVRHVARNLFERLASQIRVRDFARAKEMLARWA
jgi:hypothetical protein